MKTKTLKANIKSIVKRNKVFSIPNERTFLYTHLSEFAKNLNNNRVLDIGAGRQQYKELFQGENFYEACDLEEGFHLDQKPDFFASVYEIPKEDAHYDAVLMLQVLEHLDKPLDGLREVNRILKEDGLVFISVPQAAGDHFEPHHYFNYTQYGLQSVLEDTGFKILQHYRLAGIFTYVGNRIMKMGSITYKQYKKNGNILQKAISFLFYGMCYLSGYLVSLFNFIDKGKKYCIGHVVVAQKK